MIRSLARREATPASARNFCRRTIGEFSICDLRFAGRARMRRPLVNRKSEIVNRLRFRLGLAQAGDAIARFPLAAFLEQGDALEALEDVTIGAGGAGRAQAAML